MVTKKERLNCRRSGKKEEEEEEERRHKPVRFLQTKARIHFVDLQVRN
jgi:hypothetical protein